ncbi:uncharacterized protein L3040_007439 [Drepanopeziza brunnea f. sp. 'multigermtubi']|uniref:Uncharacterized protein n=1 Tax=Marssonina brunnea f. sp. multigermtubi (strain MB_m1) TaxID=1072389 RepID=K1X0N3_MARBU|nr:uncharacterized protein MBM_03530 [Drepanopeziza brunnea f. sp. 'multigermtubi' MB_m1]EKD18537.1 hypothetical protein MBM_03530 [Drepanopeziza brunnea f. sp. 'multigermtubi' MB_m1]KAJ5037262.1 hypothetical protein L3040_007439 [Drepanopeziza brunnea f. sp. 'multigermtubi']
MASSISADEFKDALARYPAVIQKFSKTRKAGSASLEELDKFRYQVAPINFSMKTGRLMAMDDLKKLVEWKLNHGIYRPTMTKMIASNTNEKLEAATTAAFAAYANGESISAVIEKIKEPLKGVGPATASLILAVHDPQNIIFFSDELFRWLTAGGKKVKITYSTKEFETLFKAAGNFMSKIKCTPIELEKVAFVLIKENEPVHEPKPKYEPSGRPRGRPAMAESEKKPKKPTVPGRGRGRPPKSDAEKTAAAKTKAALKPAPKPQPAKIEKAPKTNPAKEASTPKKRGRPAAADVEEESRTPAKRGRPSKGEAEETASKKRGRPASVAPHTKTPSSMKRERLSLASAAEEKTPVTKKRKTSATPASSAPASSAKKSGKKAKA